MNDQDQINNKYCCDDMKMQIEYSCVLHKNNMNSCPDKIIAYTEKSDTYGLIIHDGGESVINIDYCPWCGKKLNEIQKEDNE